MSFIVPDESCPLLHTRTASAVAVLAVLACMRKRTTLLTCSPHSGPASLRVRLQRHTPPAQDTSPVSLAIPSGPPAHFHGLLLCSAHLRLACSVLACVCALLATQVQRLQTEQLAAMTEVGRKAQYLADLVEQQRALKHLLDRNSRQPEGNRTGTALHLPFILVQSKPDATVEVQISPDMQDVQFNFFQ